MIDDPYTIASDDPCFDAYWRLVEGDPSLLIELLSEPEPIHPLLQRELGLMLSGKHADYKFGELKLARRGRPKKKSPEVHKRDQKIAAFHASLDEGSRKREVGITAKEFGLNDRTVHKIVKRARERNERFTRFLKTHGLRP